MTVLHFGFAANAMAHMFPEARLVGVSDVKVGTPVSFDFVVHIHVVIMILFSARPLPADVACVWYFLQVDSTGVLPETTS